MDLITISEFLHLTKLSEAELITMLENGELPLSFGSHQEVLINLDNLSTELLAQRKQRAKKELAPEAQELLEEVIASEVLSELSSMLNEALSLVRQWREGSTETAPSSNDN